MKAHDIGIVADEFSPESMAFKLNELDAKSISHYKHQSDLCAAELCAETNERILLAKVDDLLH